MLIDSVDALVEALLNERLLDAPQQEQLTGEFLAAFDSPRDLAKHLVQIEWLTEYQERHLFEGHATRLVIGHYSIVDRLGEGGVSHVYKAWDSRKKRHVALKVMRPELVANEDAVRQFERELDAVTRLNHPNIIRTHDGGCAGKRHYFAMEFVQGTDLEKVVQFSGALPIQEACDYIRQVASGLQYAHTMGLVHRDIKPANLYLIHPPGHDAPRPGVSWKRPADPVIKILDWGLARLQPPGGGDSSSPVTAPEKHEEGRLIGTADYIAPEQVRDPRLVDTRADIYSLGCSFYYLLTGQPPFPGNSLMQKLLQHQQQEPPPLASLRPEVPEELTALIKKMMAKLPVNRYQIPLAIAVALRRFCGDGVVSSNGHTKRPATTTATTPPRPSAQRASQPPGTSMGSLLRRKP